MTVFRTFLKVLNRCKVPIIMYTAFLIGFGGLNMQTSNTSVDFTATKPDVVIINNDENIGLTKNLIDYITDNSNIVDIKMDEDSINDAIFYREVNYVIYIPKNYRNDVLAHKNPEIQIKSSGDYNASLAEMLLEKYVGVMNTYLDISDDENTLLQNINNTLENTVKVEMTSKLDTSSLAKASFYYNFLNYSMLAGAIYVICLILNVFHEEKIKKRIIISSMDYKRHNKFLLLSNMLFAILLWIFYVGISVFLCGNVMFTFHGFILILNSFLFTCCSVTIAFLISTLIENKEAINGIVNVVALGSSFLCGAFVPVEFLPDGVLSFAHILPSYWYIHTNELLEKMEVINFETLGPILVNMIVIIVFSIIFIILTNLISKRKRKIA